MKGDNMESILNLDTRSFMVDKHGFTHKRTILSTLLWGREHQLSRVLSDKEWDYIQNLRRDNHKSKARIEELITTISKNNPPAILEQPSLAYSLGGKVKDLFNKDNRLFFLPYRVVPEAFNLVNSLHSKGLNITYVSATPDRCSEMFQESLEKQGFWEIANPKLPALLKPSVLPRDLWVEDSFNALAFKLLCYIYFEIIDGKPPLVGDDDTVIIKYITNGFNGWAITPHTQEQGENIQKKQNLVITTPNLNNWSSQIISIPKLRI